MAQKLYALEKSAEIVKDQEAALAAIDKAKEALKLDLDPHNAKILEEWSAKKANYEGDEYSYEVRGKEIKVKTTTESLSHTQIPKSDASEI